MDNYYQMVQCFTLSTINNIFHDMTSLASRSNNIVYFHLYNKCSNFLHFREMSQKSQDLSANFEVQQIESE